MRMDLEFELEEPGWKRAIACIASGTEISAQRFFSLLGAVDEEEAMEAAMELEQRGIGLDVSALPPSIQGQAAQRLKLEYDLVREGKFPGGLEPDDPLRIYCTELEQTRHLTADEAVQKLQETGDMGAAVEGLLWLVIQEATVYAGQGVLLQDLMQEGAIGLMQALENPGESLLERAQWYIRQAMARSVALQYLTSGEADRLMAAMRAYQQADRRLLQKLGRNPSIEELAQELGKTPDEAETLGKMVQDAGRVPKSKPQEEEQPESVEDSALFQLRSRVEELLSVLSPEDRELLTLRFGLEGKTAQTQEQTARSLGISLKQEQQREMAAMALLREN